MKTMMNQSVQQELLVHKVMGKMGKATLMPSNQQQRGQEIDKSLLTQANNHDGGNVSLNQLVNEFSTANITQAHAKTNQIHSLPASTNMTTPIHNNQL